MPEWLKLRIMTTPNAGEDVEKLSHSNSAVGNVSCTGSLENSLAVLQKLNMKLPYDTAIIILGIYHREMKIYAHGLQLLISKCQKLGKN